MPLVDRLLEPVGGLRKYLADARAAGQSYEMIGRRLYAEHDISTAKQTIATWCAIYEIEKKGA